MILKLLSAFLIAAFASHPCETHLINASLMRVLEQGLKVRAFTAQDLRRLSQAHSGKGLVFQEPAQSGTLALRLGLVRELRKTKKKDWPQIQDQIRNILSRQQIDSSKIEESNKMTGRVFSPVQLKTENSTEPAWLVEWPGQDDSFHFWRGNTDSVWRIKIGEPMPSPQEALPLNEQTKLPELPVVTGVLVRPDGTRVLTGRNLGDQKWALDYESNVAPAVALAKGSPVLQRKDGTIFYATVDKQEENLSVATGGNHILRTYPIPPHQNEAHLFEHEAEVYLFYKTGEQNYHLECVTDASKASHTIAVDAGEKVYSHLVQYKGKTYFQTYAAIEGVFAFTLQLYDIFQTHAVRTPVFKASPQPGWTLDNTQIFRDPLTRKDLVLITSGSEVLFYEFEDSTMIFRFQIPDLRFTSLKVIGDQVFLAGTLDKSGLVYYSLLNKVIP